MDYEFRLINDKCKTTKTNKSKDIALTLLNVKDEVIDIKSYIDLPRYTEKFLKLPKEEQANFMLETQDISLLNFMDVYYNVNKLDLDKIFQSIKDRYDTIANKYNLNIKIERLD